MIFLLLLFDPKSIALHNSLNIVEIQGNLLDKPHTDLDSHYFASSTGLHVGVSSMQGWRPSMEDAHVFVDIPSRRDHLFLAVFDGHGGDGAAHFAATHVVSFLEKAPQWVSYLGEGASNPDLLGQALTQAFENIDAAMREHQFANTDDTSGCTACAVVVTPTHIVCSNAGDTRSIMSIGGSVKELSHDHKPSNFQERKRIEAAGGRVQFDRVDGDLAVSRAFGDFQFKNKLEPNPREQKVSCIPDIIIHERTPADEMLMIACDGFWDVNSNSAAVSYVSSLFSDGENNVVKMAEELVDVAFERGSKDNISVIFVQLPGAVIAEVADGGVDRKRRERQEIEEKKKKERESNAVDRRFKK